LVRHILAEALLADLRPFRRAQLDDQLARLKVDFELGDQRDQKVAEPLAGQRRECLTQGEARRSYPHRLHSPSFRRRIIVRLGQSSHHHSYSRVATVDDPRVEQGGGFARH